MRSHAQRAERGNDSPSQQTQKRKQSDRNADSSWCNRASEYVPPSEKEANDIFAAYMEQIERAIQVVDEFPQAEVSGELK